MSQRIIEACLSVTSEILDLRQYSVGRCPERSRKRYKIAAVRVTYLCCDFNSLKSPIFKF